ncbi:MAG: CoA-binding protein [Promethearchaeota archaeon]
MREKDLSFIKNINTIALIGASAKRGYFFLRTFAETFKGNLVVISPNSAIISGHEDVPVYRCLRDVPETTRIDFAFIAIPREKILPVIDDCIQVGIKLVSIFTSNFADSGTREGKMLQEELVQKIRNSKPKIHVLGPNGMGLYFPHLGIRWRPSLPTRGGDVGIVAQSGGLCNLIIHGLHSEGLSVSKAFSIGNAVDINFLDVLSYFRDDPGTHLIIAYIEGIPSNSGSRFIELARDIGKPLILLKGGKTRVGRTAVMSHTASLAGNYRLWSSISRQAGLIMVDTLDDVLNCAKYFENSTSRSVRNVCLISMSGGYGIVCADVLVQHGVVLPDIETIPHLHDTLSSVFTTIGTSFRNPIDLAVMLFEPEKLETIFRAIMESEAFDAIVFEIPPLYLAHQWRLDINLSEAIFEVLSSIRQLYKKPMIVIIQDVGYDEIKKDLKTRLQEVRVPVYSDILPVARLLQSLQNNKNNQNKQKSI